MDLGRAAAVAAEVAAGWAQAGGPGGAVLLFDARRIHAAEAGGFAELEHRVPFTPDSLNRWASITKHIFCATLLRDGRVRMEDTLGALDAAVAPALAPVTVEDALGMTGGVPDLMESAWICGLPPTAGQSLAGSLEFARRLPALNAPPNTEVSYTNTAYLLVEAGLAARGREFAEAMQTIFAGPLDLAMHYPTDYGVVVPGLAHGYWHDGTEWRRGRTGARFSAAGAIAGSGRTLARWGQALLTGAGPAEGLLDWLAAPRALDDGTSTGYGRGLAIHRVTGIEMLGHGGSLPGYKDHILLHRPSGTGVVVVSNREDTDPYLVALRVMLAGLDATLPEPAALPAGLFAATDGSPFWIENQGDRTTFLGTAQPMFRAAGDGAMTLSPYMAMALAAQGTDIAGRVGHVPRRFAPVPADLPADPAWEGRWVLPELGAAFEVRMEGASAVLRQGVGPLAADHRLTPLGQGRAIFHRADAQWAQRPCLAFQGGTVRVVSNRSRCLVFRRG